MRSASSAFVVVLAVTAAPSVAAAQVLSLDQVGYRYSFDRQVPAATVSLVDDIVVLGGARVVNDPYGEPFVLGDATVDVRVPYRAKVVFTMTNATATPIRLQDITVYQRTIVAAQHLRGVAVGAPFTPSGANEMLAGYPGSGDRLEPGASLTTASR